MNFLQRIKDGAGKASERAQSAVEIGRLNSHISDIQREIEVHFLRMGQVFYENYSSRNTGPAEEEIMELCTACDLLTEEIAELRAKIAELRGEKLCVCGARLDADAAVCPHCGRQLTPETAEGAPAPSSGKVELRKETERKSEVESEAVHDLLGVPGFGPDEDGPYEDERYEEELRTEERRDDRERRSGLQNEAEPSETGERLPNEERFETSRLREQPSEEDEQFETKRFELGRLEKEQADEREESDQGVAEYVPSYEAAFRSGEETPEQREERQRRELREIRERERRKMKEEREAGERGAPADGPDAYAEEEAEPIRDPEHERRQRERIEREKERQDELDRLIASWNRGTEGTDEEELIVRRPVGEVVRCQVCGSGLPKGSKWCPHCASEQI
ncbi:hypothetical protein [Saccharibacillus alkalitolerans]|uniref:Zinc ribbon domain-containing protein n=1 Tax=Saccharibacillus alkalitolerans TaxID=2705290 RepID=A0ABX0FCS8_9BACL|nr:hypothetical protein [Saccharibacillus alkalitolerans]NGZ77418.1 hypothetical protein [Saccharibacillus alkalitolerans]